MRSVDAFVSCLLLIFACQVVAADVPRGYSDVAQAQDVPAKILYSVACAESGRQLPNGQIRPWPWSLNIAGYSRFYSTRTQAYQDLMEAVLRTSNIDIGLGQISWRWHAKRLKTPWQALDPYFNLATAAEILRGQFEACRCDDWWVAVERYHAPTDAPTAEDRRSRYRQNVIRCWAAI